MKDEGLPPKGETIDESFERHIANLQRQAQAQPQAGSGYINAAKIGGSFFIDSNCRI